MEIPNLYWFAQSRYYCFKTDQKIELCRAELVKITLERGGCGAKVSRRKKLQERRPSC